MFKHIVDLLKEGESFSNIHGTEIISFRTSSVIWYHDLPGNEIISDVHPDAILKVLNDSCQKSPYGDPVKQEKIKRKSAAAGAQGLPVRRASPSRARRSASHLRENNENIRFEL